MHTRTPMDQVIAVQDELSFWSKNSPRDFTEDLDESEKLSNLKPSTKIITLRVPEHLLTNIKIIANKRDIPYQSLLKVFLQERVNEELQTPFLALRKKIIKKTAITALLLIGVLSATYSQILSPIKAQGTSMNPSYPSNTFYVMDKIAYKFDVPKRGDVVVFHSPSAPGSMYFKRIVGLPGEKITLQDGAVWINGEKLYEPYVVGLTDAKTVPEQGKTVTIPGNSYYVLGDNRTSSIDSREFGFLPKVSIIGKVAGCYWNCSVQQ